MTTPGGHTAQVIIVDAAVVGSDPKTGKPTVGSTIAAIATPGKDGVIWNRAKSTVYIAGRQSFREFLITYLHEYAHVCSVDTQVEAAKAGKSVREVLQIGRDDSNACVSHEAYAKAMVDILGAFNPVLR